MLYILLALCLLFAAIFYFLKKETDFKVATGILSGLCGILFIAFLVILLIWLIAYPHTPATYQKEIDKITTQQYEIIAAEDKLTIEDFKKYEKLFAEKDKIIKDKDSRETMTELLLFCKF